jgi:hypothetical protein
MAVANQTLINALRTAAANLANGNHYEWGHHGSCNCGNLLQAAFDLDKGEIIRYAQTGSGEWTELAQDYCEITKAPYEFLVEKLYDLGLNHVDIHHIEYLSDSTVLKNLPNGFRYLEKNQRQNVVDYFETFANLLESELASESILEEAQQILKSYRQIETLVEA